MGWSRSDVGRKVERMEGGSVWAEDEGGGWDVLGVRTGGGSPVDVS